MGWSTIRNGELLGLAAKEFDAFVTVDRNLSFQQNLPAFSIAVIVLRARTNRLSDLQPDYAYGWWYKQMAEERLGRREDRVASLQRYLAVAPPDQRELIGKARELLASLAP